MTGQDTHHTVPACKRDFINKQRVDGGPASHQLRVYRNGQPTKPRSYHVLTRMGPPHNFGVFNNNVNSVKRALLERYFLCSVGGTFHRPLEVSPSAFDTRYMREFRRGVVSLVQPDAHVLTVREVVACYTGAKRRIYEKAYESLCAEPLNRGDSTLRPFTKFEKQALDKACRIINPRSPRYNVMLGKYLKKTEKLYYKAINKVWGARTAHTVIKGLNVVEAASVVKDKWDRYSDPVAIGLDAVKFDMHVGVPALEYEHSIYNATFRCTRLRRLLYQQLYNRGKAYCPDGEVSFRMPGTRSSGDLNTSLGNCLLMCALIWAYARELGIDCELCNNGDDCVVIMERADAARFRDGVPRWFGRRGFRMTVEETVDVFEKIDFCQSSPMFDGRLWRMVRNVRTCLKKDPMCLLPIANEKALRKWLWAVGTCGLALVPGVPVLREFYRVFERHGVRTSKRHIVHIFRGTNMVERLEGVRGDWDPTPESRASFWRMTGITPDYQLALERYYRELKLDCRLLHSGGEGPAEVRPIPALKWL